MHVFFHKDTAVFCYTTVFAVSRWIFFLQSYVSVQSNDVLACNFKESEVILRVKARASLLKANKTAFHFLNIIQ